MSCDVGCVLSVVGVACVWGATNPLLRAGARTTKDFIDASSLPPVLRPLVELANLFLNWRFALPFALNQAGSVLFVWLVAAYPVSLVVPIVNSLQLVATAVTGALLGECLSGRAALGCALISSGVVVMIASEQNL